MEISTIRSPGILFLIFAGYKDNYGSVVNFEDQALVFILLL